MRNICFILFAAAFLGFARFDDYKNGMKALKLGNKAEALEYFIAKVSSKPNHQKSVDMIKQLLPLVIEMRQTKAKRYEESDQWDRAQKEYDRLRRLDKVLRTLTVFDNGEKMRFPVIDVGAAQSQAADNAAEKFYLKGVAAMQKPGNAEEAVELFKEARKFDPDYKDAKELSAKALYNDAAALFEKSEYKQGVYILWRIRDFYPDGFQDSEEQTQAGIDSAKVKVAVMPFDDLTFKARYGDAGANLSSEIIASGVGRDPVFVDFVTRDYVYSLLNEQDFGASGRVDASTAPRIGKLIGVQVFVFGKITAINPFYPKVVEIHGESRAVITTSEREYPVYARWTKYTRKGQVSVTATYQVVDVKTGRIVDSKSVSRKMASTAQWVTFTGDEEALERSVLSHHTTGDVSIHPPGILANDAIRMISTSIAQSILGYYND